MVLDGFITGAAALVAATMAPGIGPRLIASHRSAEPGHAVVIEQLGLDPLFDLDLRLGEGSGAALALPLIRSATLLLAGMATFDSAGVSGPLPEAPTRFMASHVQPCMRPDRAHPRSAPMLTTTPPQGEP